MHNECTNKDVDTGLIWCDVELSDDGQWKCANESCVNPISGEISDDILQTATEMFAYIIARPSQERV